MKKIILLILTLTSIQLQAASYYCQNADTELLIETPYGTTATYAVMESEGVFFEMDGTKTDHSYKKDGTLLEEFFLQEVSQKLPVQISISSFDGSIPINKKPKFPDKGYTDNLIDPEIIKQISKCTRSGCDFPKIPIKLAPIIEASVLVSSKNPRGGDILFKVMACETIN